MQTKLTNIRSGGHVFVVVANEFSSSICSLYSNKIVNRYVAYKNTRYEKLFKILLMITQSWFLWMMRTKEVTLIIPHFKGSFGIFYKLIYHKKLVIVDDGISMLTRQSFQKEFILPYLRVDKFSRLLVCEDHSMADICEQEKLYVIPRKKVVCELLKNKTTLPAIPENSVLLIDNGVWTNKELEQILEKIYLATRKSPLIIAHPARIENTAMLKLDVCAEYFLLKKIGIYTQFMVHFHCDHKLRIDNGILKGLLSSRLLWYTF